MSERKLDIDIPIYRGRMAGTLAVPERPQGLVLFAHGSGSSRFSPRNRFVAASLGRAGFATLLLDLLMAAEEDADAATGRLRFDIELLADRVIAATDWLVSKQLLSSARLGYFGASTGAAAALVAAAQRPSLVSAIVSRGGRADLAGGALASVTAPTLLIVGGDDHGVIELNESALRSLAARDKTLQIVPGASHLFEEPGTLAEVARLAQMWFTRFLVAHRHDAQSTAASP